MSKFLALGFLGAAIVFPYALSAARTYKFTDKPGKRKVHHTPTAVVGGLVAMAVTIAISTIANFNILEAREGTFLGVIALSLMLGLTDDFLNLSAGYRLQVQLLISLAVALGGYRIHDFHGILGINELPLALQYPITIFILTGIINAFNLMDGINGLVGGLSLINVTVLGYMLQQQQSTFFASVAFTLAGALLVFLYYNVWKKTVFLGDAGSLTLGLIQGIFAIAVLNGPIPALPMVVYPMALIVALFAIPIADTLRVMLGRVMMGKSPFTPTPRMCTTICSLSLKAIEEVQAYFWLSTLQG